MVNPRRWQYSRSSPSWTSGFWPWLSVLILAYRAARIGRLLLDCLVDVMPMAPNEMGIRYYRKQMPPTVRRLVGLFAVIATSPFGKPPCVPVGWSRLSRCPDADSFYLRRRPVGMAQKFRKVITSQIGRA